MSYGPQIQIFWRLCCCCCYITSVVSYSVRHHRRQPTRLPRSLGFSRQEHWSGLPFPFSMHKSESEVAQSCPTLSDPMDCSPPGSSVHGIFQAGVLEWGAIAFSEALLALNGQNRYILHVWKFLKIWFVVNIVQTYIKFPAHPEHLRCSSASRTFSFPEILSECTKLGCISCVPLKLTYLRAISQNITKVLLQSGYL